jgi:predicted dienelactone hydrolase
MVGKRLIIALLIVVLALGLLSAVQAQEGKPEAKGLRPDAPPYALHGPYWVGTMEFEAKTEYHDTTVQVWYPALNPDGRTEEVTYSQFWAVANAPMPWEGHAIDSASPDGTDGPYPLVIFAHALFMARFTSAYLAEHVASHGLVVLGIEYADDTKTLHTADTDLSVYTRPRDVSWQIDYADELAGSGGALEGMIDTGHVAVVGHSYGAYTALMAGGAQLDLNGPTSACVLYPALDQGCDATARKVMDLSGLETVPEGLWPSWGDPRVDAIVPLAPDMFPFGSESLKSMTIPTMILVGSKDQAVHPELPLYRPYLYDNLGSATKLLVMFENASHYIFFDACEAAPWLRNRGLSWLCSDPEWDMDHTHDLINHFVTAFLLATLKGDTDAAAALAPDQVQFPGITYEAQGF